MIFQSVLKVYWITENGQNMAKIEKIGNIQIVDNKEDKFFYFPMISMACTGSGYWNGDAQCEHPRSCGSEIANLSRWPVICGKRSFLRDIFVGKRSKMKAKIYGKRSCGSGVAALTGVAAMSYLRRMNSDRSSRVTKASGWVVYWRIERKLFAFLSSATSSFQRAGETPEMSI